MADFMMEKLLDAAMLLQQKLVLVFDINLEMNPLWTWTLLVPCDALIVGDNGFLDGINGSRHSCGTLTFKLGVICIIDLKNGVGWCLSYGVHPFCFSNCLVAQVQVEFAHWNMKIWS
ncbi:hypothetical protein AMTRI_Chr07g27570 [Amborella trichopoda]